MDGSIRRAEPGNRPVTIPFESITGECQMNESIANNFEYHVPTDVRFGRGQIRCLEKEIGKYGKKLLLVFNDGFKKSTLHTEIKDIFKEYELQECPGIESNPKLLPVENGAMICKKDGIEAILAIGGRAEIDTAKLIACAAFYDGEPWDLVKDSTKVTKALPVFVVLTGAATGSEVGPAAMICNEQMKEKAELRHPILYPKLAVCDPSYQFSLSKEETADGIVDVFTQVMEQLCQSADGGDIKDQVSGMILKTLIKYAPVVLAKPEDYEARYSLTWAGAVGLGQVMAFDRNEVRSVHPLAMELSAKHDISHGVGMSLLMTEWMRFVLTEETWAKFAKYARMIWNVTYDDDHTAARVGIDRMEEFFRKIGMPRMLSDMDIDDSEFSAMSAAAVENAGLTDRAYVSLTASDVEQIYRNCW